MSNRYKELATPEGRRFIAGVLDNAVDMAVTHWYFMEGRTRERDSDGVLTDSCLEEYNFAQMEMALYGAARSIVGDNDRATGDPDPLTWSPYAQKGLRRMSRRLGVVGMAQCARNNRVFTGLREQTEIYDEAMDHRIVLAGPPIEASDPQEYAVRVALREIALDFAPVPGWSE